MSDSKKLSAIEACKEIAKTMRGELDKLTKTELTPADAGLKVSKSIIEIINQYQDELVKMRQLEKGEKVEVSREHLKEDIEEATASIKRDKKALAKKKMKKTDGSGLPAEPTKSDTEIGMMKKDTFNADKAAYAEAKPVDTQSKKPFWSGKGRVLPDDKSPKDLSVKDAGSNLEVKKGKKMTKGESPAHKSAAAHKAIADKIWSKAAQKYGLPAPSEQQAPKYQYDLKPEDPVAKAGGVTMSPATQPLPKIKNTSLHNVGMDTHQADKTNTGSAPTKTSSLGPTVASPNKTVATPTTNLGAGAVKAPSGFTGKAEIPMKKASLPRLGGKDHASMQMTHDASKAALKDAHMPAAQKQTEIKMPNTAMDLSSGSPKEVDRSSMLADHTPPGKWKKNELMKEMEELDKAIGVHHDIAVGEKKGTKKPYGPGHFPELDKKPEAPKPEVTQKAEACSKCGKTHGNLQKKCS